MFIFCTFSLVLNMIFTLKLKNDSWSARYVKKYVRRFFKLCYGTKFFHRGDMPTYSTIKVAYCHLFPYFFYTVKDVALIKCAAFAAQGHVLSHSDFSFRGIPKKHHCQIMKF